VTLLGRPEREVWLMPLGALLDQWEIYKMVHGMVKSEMRESLDQLIPQGL